MIRALLCVACLTGAAQSAAAFSLVGKWACEPVAEEDFSMAANLTYRKNGRSVHRLQAQGDTDDGFLSIDLKVWGKWSLDGTSLEDKITRHKMTSASLNNRTLPKNDVWRDLSATLAESFETGDEEDDLMSLDIKSDSAFILTDDDFQMSCRRIGPTPTS